MAFYPRKRRGRAPKRAPRRYGRKRAVKKLSKPMTKAIQKIIHKDVETKSAFTSTTAVAFNSGINSSGDIQIIIPDIQNSTYDNGRIGDQIRAQRLRVKGILTSNLTYTTNSQCRLGVRVFIVQPKMYSNYDAINVNATTWMGALLKKGLSTTGFTGVINDLQADVNTDAITVMYDKVFYVNTPYMATSVGEQSTYNSVKFINKTFNLRNKLLKYDTAFNSAKTPTNFNPVLLVGYVHLDGSGPDTVSTQVSFTTDTYLDYEDA